jgi:ribosomal protein S18 acetylase RimI-like enzyme
MVEKVADSARQDDDRWADDVCGAWASADPAHAEAVTWLRPARLMDRDFAAALYFDSMRKLLAPLGKWDEDRVTRRFRRCFRVEQSQIICRGHIDIGWIQVSETSDHFHLHQIHIVERFRNRGIGGELITALLRRAQAVARPVVLNVVRGNPAMSLYARLGFRPVRADAEKVLMRWEPDQPPRG